MKQICTGLDVSALQKEVHEKDLQLAELIPSHESEIASWRSLLTQRNQEIARLKQDLEFKARQDNLVSSSIQATLQSKVVEGVVDHCARSFESEISFNIL